MAGEPAIRFVRYEHGGAARYGVLDGDIYAITVEGVGTLTNPCVAEDDKD